MIDRKKVIDAVDSVVYLHKWAISDSWNIKPEIKHAMEEACDKLGNSIKTRIMDEDIEMIDAVEVIRCKDCKYSDYDCMCVVCEDGNHVVCKKFLFLRHVTKNCFCSYGERKDGETE